MSLTNIHNDDSSNPIDDGPSERLLPPAYKKESADGLQLDNEEFYLGNMVDQQYRFQADNGTANNLLDPANKYQGDIADSSRSAQDHGARSESIAGRAELSRPSKKVSTALRTLGGALTFGLLGGGGAATGVVLSGSATLIGSIAAGTGIGTAAFPIVGTVIGAVVGLCVGLAIGGAYGKLSATISKADYLDTSVTFQHKLQRASAYSGIRFLMPVNLAKRTLRLFKLPRRNALMRGFLPIIRKLFHTVGPDQQLLEWEARGRNATAEEARRDYRYVVAAQSAGSCKNPQNEIRDFASRQNKETFRANADRDVSHYWQYSKAPEAVSSEELQAIVPGPRTPKQWEEYNKNPEKYYRRRYAARHEVANQVLLQSDITRKALKPEHGVKPWSFHAIGPESPNGSVPRLVCSCMPDSLQKSLASGGGVFRDTMTGNNIRIIFDDTNNEVIVAYNQTAGGPLNLVAGHSPQARAQQRGNVTNYAGGKAPSVEQAKQVGLAVRRAVADANRLLPRGRKLKVVSTGHSRGGMLAGVEALNSAETLGTKCKVVTFNTEPWGAGVRDDAGLYSSEAVTKHLDIINYSTKNEPLSGSGTMSGAGNIGETGSPFAFPVIYGPRRILPNVEGTFSHIDPDVHMAELASGGRPPTKAFNRDDPLVNDPLLYWPNNEAPIHRR